MNVIEVLWDYLWVSRVPFTDRKQSIQFGNKHSYIVSAYGQALSPYIHNIHEHHFLWKLRIALCFLPRAAAAAVVAALATFFALLVHLFQ